MKKILVISHDVGGANILASLIKKYQDNFEWLVMAFGPAQAIFYNKKIVLLKPIESSKDWIKSILNSAKPDLVLTGTSWGSDIENQFIKLAKISGFKTAAFLDHWANYRERFGYPGKWQNNLPDFVFVGDKWAYKLALQNNFPAKRILKVENPYFEEIIKQTKLSLKEQQSQRLCHILFVSEPVATHLLKTYQNKDYLGYTEYSVLKDLLDIIKQLNKIKKNIRLRIRLHPAEIKYKFNQLLSNKQYFSIINIISLSLPDKNLLTNDSLWADMVIGIDSMALVVASIIGRKTISYIPTKCHNCSLPRINIDKIKSKENLLKTIKYYKFSKQNKINRPQRLSDKFLQITENLLNDINN